MRIIAQLVNFNTSNFTGECVGSLLAAGFRDIHVLDNASLPADRARLEHISRDWPETVSVTYSTVNLGFAAGSNLLIDKALSDATVTHVFLVNNDAVVDPNGIGRLLERVRNNSADMYGGRMMQRGGERSNQVDSLGIALYRPLLASNRKHDFERFLGPTGGLAVYSRRLLESLRDAHGHCFDPEYFCYAEDTDLCIRARLMGFEAEFEDSVVAYHTGQASSGGGFNDFVYYHCISNSIITLLKSIPARTLLPRLPWIFALHAGIVVRHTLRGKFILTLKIYRDAFRRWPQIRIARRRIMESVRRTAALEDAITPRFYEQDYLAAALRDLFRRCGGMR